MLPGTVVIGDEGPRRGRGPSMSGGVQEDLVASPDPRHTVEPPPTLRSQLAASFPLSWRLPLGAVVVLVVALGAIFVRGELSVSHRTRLPTGHVQARAASRHLTTARSSTSKAPSLPSATVPPGGPVHAVSINVPVTTRRCISPHGGCDHHPVILHRSRAEPVLDDRHDGRTERWGIRRHGPYPANHDGPDYDEHGPDYHDDRADDDQCHDEHGPHYDNGHDDHGADYDDHGPDYDDGPDDHRPDYDDHYGQGMIGGGPNPAPRRYRAARLPRTGLPSPMIPWAPRYRG